MYLKEFREYLNMTQKDLSLEIDIAQNAIARYETGKVIPTVTVIYKYVETFNANPNFLLLGLEPKILENDTAFSYRKK